MEEKQKVKQTDDVSLQKVLPEKYVKPFGEMINRFTATNLGASAACGPIAVAVAVAIVIVLWDRPLKEMVLTDMDKLALKYASEQINADPELVQKLTGFELTPVHMKLMEALAM